MYQILETINEKTEKGRLSEDRLRDTFDIWWPKLKLDVGSIRKKEEPDAEEPEKTPDTDEPKKRPNRTVEAARKSEEIKPQDTGKPARKVAARPAPEEIEIEILNVLYDPPGYTPRTADAVGYKRNNFV